MKIIRRPEGEAPEWVRDAWIGVVLPLMNDEAVTTSAFGVFSGPKSRIGEWWRCITRRYDVVRGYQVEADVAIRVLAEVRPDAAEWWRTHAPQFVRPGSAFIFDAPACERLS